LICCLLRCCWQWWGVATAQKHWTRKPLRIKRSSKLHVYVCNNKVVVVFDWYLWVVFHCSYSRHPISTVLRRHQSARTYCSSLFCCKCGNHFHERPHLVVLDKTRSRSWTSRVTQSSLPRRVKWHASMGHHEIGQQRYCLTCLWSSPIIFWIVSCITWRTLWIGNTAQISRKTPLNIAPEGSRLRERDCSSTCTDKTCWPSLLNNISMSLWTVMWVDAGVCCCGWVESLLLAVLQCSDRRFCKCLANRERMSDVNAAVTGMWFDTERVDCSVRFLATLNTSHSNRKWRLFSCVTDGVARCSCVTSSAAIEHISSKIAFKAAARLLLLCSPLNWNRLARIGKICLHTLTRFAVVAKVPQR
jgi:hypothetical protein